MTTNYSQLIEEILTRHLTSGGFHITPAVIELEALIHSAQKEELERIKTAFVKHFSGAGELWFPYNSPYVNHPISQQEIDQFAIDEWEELLEDYNCPRQE